jgi:hypothetical protein
MVPENQQSFPLRYWLVELECLATLLAAGWPHSLIAAQISHGRPGGSGLRCEDLLHCDFLYFLQTIAGDRA